MPVATAKHFSRLGWRRFVCWACIVLAAAVLFGCSRFQSFPGPSDPEALVLLQQIHRKNDGLKTFKGRGLLRFQAPNAKPLRERVVWVGALPARIRVDILAAGQTMVKMAADGAFLYVVDMAGIFDPSRFFRKIRVSDPDLKRMISVPIKISELVALLAGKIPMVDYDAVRFEAGLSDRQVLVLGRRWSGAVQKVYLGKDDGELIEVVRFDRNGRFRYRAAFERLQSVGGYRVPARLVLTGPDDARLVLSIERYWADAEVTPDMFRLEKPETLTSSS